MISLTDCFFACFLACAICAGISFLLGLNIDRWWRKKNRRQVDKEGPDSILEKRGRGDGKCGLPLCLNCLSAAENKTPDSGGGG